MKSGSIAQLRQVRCKIRGSNGTILDAYWRRQPGLLDLKDRANGMQRIAHEAEYKNCLMTSIDGIYGAGENSVRI